MPQMMECSDKSDSDAINTSDSGGSVDVASPVPVRPPPSREEILTEQLRVVQAQVAHLKDLVAASDGRAQRAQQQHLLIAQGMNKMK